jgi:hypothetical protein
MMQEHRKYTRFVAEGKVIIKLKDSNYRSINCDLADVSMKGLGVYVGEKLEEGSDVNFVIMTKFWEKPVLGTGKVRYVLLLKKNEGEVFRTGIEFVNTEKEAIDGIIDHIQADMAKRQSA